MVLVDLTLTGYLSQIYIVVGKCYDKNHLGEESVYFSLLYKSKSSKRARAVSKDKNLVKNLIRGH